MVIVILRRSSMTQLFVWRGSTRVLRRSFAGSRGSIYCLRGGEAMRGVEPCGPARVPRVLRTSRAALAAPRDSILSGSGPVIVWRGSTLGPRRS